MRTRFLFLMAALLLTTIFSGCKKEGCTDPDSVDYCADCTSGGQCNYEGYLVFWFNASTAQILQDDEAYSLSFYFDNKLVGSQGTNTYFPSNPGCESSQAVTVTVDLGTSRSKNFLYRVVDQTGWEYYSGTITIEANTCLGFQLD